MCTEFFPVNKLKFELKGSVCCSCRNRDCSVLTGVSCRPADKEDVKFFSTCHLWRDNIQCCQTSHEFNLTKQKPSEFVSRLLTHKTPNGHKTHRKIWIIIVIFTGRTQEKNYNIKTASTSLESVVNFNQLGKTLTEQSCKYEGVKVAD